MAILLNPAAPEQIAMAAEYLRQGTPVALPTETVYGLAAPVADERALARVFALKARPHFDPLIVHVLDLAQARQHAQNVSALHERLAAAFWPGPLTLLFERNTRVPELCTAGSPFVAMRAPQHTLFREILQRVGGALAAPSANRFARVSPTTAEHVLQELGPYGLEAVLDGGPCALGLESSVVKIHSEREVEVVRLGALSLEILRQELGPTVQVRVRESGSGAVNEAPGQLARHYAPALPLHFVPEADKERMVAALQTQDLGRCALLAPYPELTKNWHELSWGTQRVLSERGSDVEAAAKLFATLRELERGQYRVIYALAADDRGLGPALNDRLRRASS